MSDDITQDPEYIRGYEESMYFQKLDERSKSAHSQGYAAALEFLKAEYMQSDEYKEKEKQGKYKAFKAENWEDITQDPEYQAGYEVGIKEYKFHHSKWAQGLQAGLHALETPQTVESKASPIQRKQTLEERFEAIEKQQSSFEERLAKLEKYTQE